MPEKLKVGWIGTGGIANFQAKNLLERRDDVEVYAGADVSQKALQRFADAYEVEHNFEDYNEMLQLDELDAVSVCTPNYLHRDPTVAALEAGKHVMVEKPMAMNAQEAQAMVDAASEDATLVIGFQYRLSPEAQMLKRYADAGEMGDVMFARVQALRRRGIPNWGVFGRKELQGGGPLIDIGVHLIECAHYLMGQPTPVAASASTYTYMGDRPSNVKSPWAGWDWETYNVEDLAVGFVRFHNGACMSIESSFVAHIKENNFNIQLMGEKGGCTLHPPEVFKDEAGTMVNVSPDYLPKYHSMAKKMDDWIGYLRGERQTECPGQEGLLIQKILDGLYQSAAEGREVAID